MADTCVKHSFELAKDVCRQCHNSYCEECLIYSFGPKKQPFCVTCALNAAGVRRSGAKHNPRVRRKGLFGRLKAVEEPVRREKGFDEIQIELPQGAETAPAIRNTRRKASPELVEVVAAAEAATAPAPVADVFPGQAPEISADEVSLADWAASLGEPTEAKPRGFETNAWPETETEIAPWPDEPGSSF